MDRRSYDDFIARLAAPIVIDPADEAAVKARLNRVGAAVYVQLRGDGSVYVGEAQDVLERQKEHLACGVRLVSLAVVPLPDVPYRERYQFETRVIAMALAADLPLANTSKCAQARGMIASAARPTTHAYAALVGAVGDKVLSEWGTAGWMTHDEEKASSDEAARVQAFLLSPGANEALVLLNRFVRRMVPAPEEGYGRWWRFRVEKSSDADLAALVEYAQAVVCEVRCCGNRALARTSCEGPWMDRALLDEWLANGAVLKVWPEDLFDCASDGLGEACRRLLL